MDVLSSRTLLYPSDFAATVAFYDEVLGLHRFREYGVDGRVTGVVWFLGGGFLEATSHRPDDVVADAARAPMRLWLQVADLAAEHARLRSVGAEVVEPPARMPWGLWECWVVDPDGVRLCLVEVPDDHPIRRRL